METPDSIIAKIEALLEKIKVHNSEIGNYVSHILLSDRIITYLVKLNNGEIRIYEKDVLAQENLTQDLIKELAKKFRKKREPERLDSKFLDGPARALPIIYIVLIFCGALYFNIYYGTFNINIFKYLDISEILVSFLNVLIPILILFITSFILIMVAVFFSEKRGFSIYHDHKNLWLSIGGITGATYIGFALNCSVGDYEISNYYYFLIPLMVYYAACIAHEFLIQTEDSLKNTFLHLMLALMVVTSYSALNDVEIRVISTRYEFTTILMKDSTAITTNSSYYYVGRTNGYIFLYNSTDHHRDLISVDDIKRISFYPLNR